MPWLRLNLTDVNTIVLFPLIPILIAILGVTFAIYRLKTSQERERSDKERKEDAQNRLYEVGRQFETISGLLQSGRAPEACRLFWKLSKEIDGFNHSDFSTLEWKNYFGQVCASRDQMKVYLSANYSGELKSLYREEETRQLKNQADFARCSKQARFVILVSLFLFAIAFLTLFLAAR